MCTYCEILCNDFYVYYKKSELHIYIMHKRETHLIWDSDIGSIINKSLK